MSGFRPAAVVTGASRGIGKAIADRLVKENYRVIYSAATPRPELPGYIQCDISSAEARKRLLYETTARFGRVDVLINNAGVAPTIRADILETDAESFRRVMDINLEGTFFMCQLFARQMIEQPKMEGYNSKIINIASISSYTSSVSRGEYCVSKAGVSMVTKLFADRLAEYGIGVFEVRPGVILTDMTEAVKDKYGRLINEGLTPVKRFGLPEDVANAVASICAGGFDFSTGQVFNVDGGFHLRRL